MASAKGKLLRWAGGWALRDGAVAEVADLGPHFRRVRVEGPGLRDARWQPGDKLQVLMPSDDVRTLTPIGWDPAGGTSFLLYLHAGGALAPWARALRVGDPFRFAGPSRSLRVPDGPVTLVGDETSIAVAAAIAATRPGTRAVFEAGPDVELGPVLEAAHVDATVIRREPGDAHHAAIVHRVHRETGAMLLTGGGALVQGVRSGLRHHGVRPAKVKAYWIAGRVALD